MNRRNALKNLGLSFGAIAVTPSIIGMMQSCTSSSSGFRPKVFSKTQFKHVEKILNLILPQTEDGIPGASELGLAEFVDNYLHGVVGDKQVSLLRLSLDSFIQDINESDDPEHLDRFLSKYFKASKDDEESWNSELNAVADGTLTAEDISVESKSYLILTSLREFATYAFRINRIIVTEHLHHVPIPGQQKGCISLSEATGGRLHGPL